MARPTLIVLEFDHRGEKAFDVGKGLRDRNWQAVLDEMASATSFVQTVTVAEPLVAEDSRVRR